MTDLPPLAEAPERREQGLELVKEGFTTALYVAICLLAALIAPPETGGAREHVIRIIWGVTIGPRARTLVRVSLVGTRGGSRSRPAGERRIRGRPAGGSRRRGAAGVDPVVVFDASPELAFVELVLAAFVGLLGFCVARGVGANRTRSLVYAIGVLVIALLIAGLKNGMAGH
jgi:hypothetical protein